MTHTFATLEVSEGVYDEVADLLKEAGYDHAFVDGVLDMHGIGLTRGPKLSRNATGDEIFPGKHKPLNKGADVLLETIMRALKAGYGDDYLFTVFVDERHPRPGMKEKRFNYASTADRRDMIAVMKAFIERHGGPEGQTLEQFMNSQVGGRKQ